LKNSGQNRTRGRCLAGLDERSPIRLRSIDFSNQYRVIGQSMIAIAAFAKEK